MLSADAKTPSGSPAGRWPTNARWATAVAVVAALVPVVGLWGFTVDDALITARVAHHLATGVGYRFNAGGAIVDAVTPLGYALVLAPFAAASPIAALHAAKLLDAIAWLIAAALVGARAGKAATRSASLVPLAALAVCAPTGAWAVSGMETGIVTLLATLALTGRIGGALAAGAAAAWRPELIPWAVVVSAGLAYSETPASPASVRARRALGRALVVLAFPAAVVVTRWVLFAHAAPLAVIAKPADLGQGLAYSSAALLGTGPAWLLVAPRAVRRLPPRERWLTVAIGVHFAAIALAGGDWMWLFRLAVPVIPSMFMLGVAIAERSAWTATLARTLVACAAAVWTSAPHALDARAIGPRRERLIDGGRAAFGSAARVASVDVGWVGAATSAPVVDLGGATDPEIAALPGSHTSKRIYPGLLAARGVDAVVLLLAPGAGVADPWQKSRFARQVEAHVARLPDLDDFVPVKTLALGGVPQDYVVLRRPH